jgi:hypothetical protein
MEKQWEFTNLLGFWIWLAPFTRSPRQTCEHRNNNLDPVPWKAGNIGTSTVPRKYYGNQGPISGICTLLLIFPPFR